MNKVGLEGTLSRPPKSGTGTKGAWCFFSVQPTGERGFIPCASFGEAAELLARASEGQKVKVVGRIGSTKDKLLTEKIGKDVWVLQVVVDREQGGKVEIEEEGF